MIADSRRCTSVVNSSSDNPPSESAPESDAARAGGGVGTVATATVFGATGRAEATGATGAGAGAAVNAGAAGADGMTGVVVAVMATVVGVVVERTLTALVRALGGAASDVDAAYALTRTLAAAATGR